MSCLDVIGQLLACGVNPGKDDKVRVADIITNKGLCQCPISSLEGRSEDSAWLRECQGQEPRVQSV